MFKYICFALVALTGSLCQATLETENPGLTLASNDDTEISEQLFEDGLREAVEELDGVSTGRELQGSRQRDFIHKFNSHKFKQPKKPRGKKDRKGKRSVRQTSSTKKFSSTKRTTVSKAKCTAVAKASTVVNAKNKLIVAVAKAIAIGCGAKGKVKIGKLVNVLSAGTVAVAKATTSAFAKCESKGNAVGCAAAKSQATAIAKAFAVVVAKAYAKAKNKCNHCIGVASESFVEAIDVIKIIAWAESKASAYVCVKGNAKAVAYEKCYTKTIAVAFARAIASAFLKTAGGCYEDAKAKAAVQAEIETGFIEKIIGKCKSFKKEVTFKPRKGKGKGRKKRCRGKHC